MGLLSDALLASYRGSAAMTSLVVLLSKGTLINVEGTICSCDSGNVLLMSEQSHRRGGACLSSVRKATKLSPCDTSSSTNEAAGQYQADCATRDNRWSISFSEKSPRAPEGRGSDCIGRSAEPSPDVPFKGSDTPGCLPRLQQTLLIAKLWPRCGIDAKLA